MSLRSSTQETYISIAYLLALVITVVGLAGSRRQLAFEQTLPHCRVVSSKR